MMRTCTVDRSPTEAAATSGSQLSRTSAARRPPPAADGAFEMTDGPTTARFIVSRCPGAPGVPSFNGIPLTDWQVVS